MDKFWSKSIALSVVTTITSFNFAFSVDLPVIKEAGSVSTGTSVGIANWEAFNKGKDANVNINVISVDNRLPDFSNGKNVNVTTNANNMNIQILGGNHSVGSANWNSFNIGRDAKVNVEFTAPYQTSLNKVSASGGMSQIYGQFTNSGYSSTGKVILLNPNGILFGKGANVDLNSITASTLNGKFNNNTNSLVLTKTGKTTEGIIVEDGAVVKGDKNVSFVSDNINLYKGSQIKTGYAMPQSDWLLNGDNKANSIKLVTSDGITFKYANEGNVNSESKIVSSSKKMNINLHGDIDATNIEVRNASTNEDSHVNIAGANLRAHKFISSKDGSIYIVSNNDVNIDNSNLQMVNSNSICSSDECMSVYYNYYSPEYEWYSTEGEGAVSTEIYPVSPVTLIQTREYDATPTENQSIKISAKKDLNINSSKLYSAHNSNDLKLASTAGSVSLNNTDIYANANVNIQAKNNLNVNSSNLQSSDIKLTSSNGNANVDNSELWALANNINIKAKNDSLITNNSLKARNAVNLTSVNGSEYTDGNYIYTNKLTAKSNKELGFVNNKIAAKNASLKSSNNDTYVFDNSIYTENNLTVSSKEKLHFGNNKILSNNVKLSSSNNQGFVFDNNIYAKKALTVSSKYDSGIDNNILNAGSNITLSSTEGNAFVNNNEITTSKKLKVNSKEGTYVLGNDIWALKGTEYKAENNNIIDIDNNYAKKRVIY